MVIWAAARVDHTPLFPDTIDRHIYIAYNISIWTEHMRTTLNLADELMNELDDLAEGKTKTQIITEALEDYIRKKRKERLLSLRGKISLDYDWKAEEERELLSVKEERNKYGKGRSR